MVNRFRDPTMRQHYEASVKAYDMKHRDLFRGDERKHSPNFGSSFAQHFWNGFDGISQGRWDAASKKMLGYAIWRAGQDCAKRVSA